MVELVFKQAAKNNKYPGFKYTCLYSAVYLYLFIFIWIELVLIDVHYE